ncbi:hypothetical protein ACFDTO_32740 [Microbacteriaceae bacterium 4G12]
MQKILKCIHCGSEDLKEGRVGGGAHAYVVPDSSTFAFNGGKRSKLLVRFCLDCGEVHSFRVEKPEVFRR